MKAIDPKDINDFIGKRIRMTLDDKMIIVEVMVSMGPMYFLIKDGENVAHVYKGKTSIPTKLYEL